MVDFVNFLQEIMVLIFIEAPLKSDMSKMKIAIQNKPNILDTSKMS